MTLADSYDIPEDVSRGPHSPAFGQFLRNWFGDTYALTHGELDLSFLDDLTPEELALARGLVKRNLKLRQTHIIEGTSALHDVSAVPILRAMLDEESDVSRRLTIAGALWKLIQDPIFIDCLNSAKASGRNILCGNHLLQVLWLGDGRAVDFLIGMLPEKDGESHFWRVFRRICFRWPFRSLLARAYLAHAHTNMEGNFALGLLNELESGHRMGVPAWEMPRQPSDYRKRRHDPAFRELMVGAVREWNAEMKNGR
jgi:hypothetical protein